MKLRWFVAQTGDMIRLQTCVRRTCWRSC